MTGRDQVAADVALVTQLVLRERQSRDRGWWDDMTDCFAPEAVIDMSWFTGAATEFIARTRARSTGGVWGRHRLSPPAVRVHGDRAWAELPLGIEFSIDIDGVPADLVSYCRSQYRAERTDGTWKLTRITSVYERDTITPSIPGQRLPLAVEEFADQRPSYRCLSWYFARQGTRLSDQLLGDDEPEAVARHYEAERRWLGADAEPPGGSRRGGATGT